VDVGEPLRIDLFTFRPTTPGAWVDGALRASVVPRLLAGPGLIDAFAGRQGPDEQGERVLVSVWALDDGADVAGLSGLSGLGCFQPETEDAIRAEGFSSLPIGLALRFAPPGAPAVLRVFRGEVRPGELDVYIAEAREGILADAFARFAPNALFLGLERPDRFVTVSLWSAWTSIERATNGDIRRPIGTRNAERIRASTVVHYELLPDMPGTERG
jgi:hypothetical protein